MVDDERRWLILVMSLSGRAGSTRMRLWRALRGMGAAVLRDGVYLLPAGPSRYRALHHQADAIQALGGKSLLIEVDETRLETTEVLPALFDRDSEYQELLEAVASWQQECPSLEEREAQRRLLQLQRRLQATVEIDFFPGTIRERAVMALADAEATYNRCFVPDEPKATRAGITALDRSAFRGRLWATRRHLWVDRVASAWLIQRFIDPEARFLWLESPAQCPPEALGFDFDGAAFTHADDKVTFEVLLARFGLVADGALVRLGELVHYLDVGGAPVPEAAGLKLMLSGARERCPDDDALLAHVGMLLDDAYQAYTGVHGSA
ncbi:chromate resistance protein ChrB domain-containing protein [Halomonas alkalicola]|uniref:Chromate resistance protein n=1 Tax=Halomonas alkalicola TaxID=1930622 RepID=A0ABY9H449_9GAMM|nr:chromate resistance protein ChrB domain-containing protein [Halomonas alkalicola]WLI73247.1 chromate resistance protein [Halomonas alkalicola]